jgi:uncharacterized protein (TIGR01244 family)
MEDFIKINDELTVATTQVTSELLQQSASKGFKSVFNLRSPDEEGFLKDEQQQAETIGLQYVNLPVKPKQISNELTHQVLKQIEQLTKPALIHCKTGMRSGLMALIYVATRQGITAKQALEKGKQLGFSLDEQPQMKQFFQNYISPES